MTNSPQSAYVHVPFCRHRCGYCDFPLIAGRDDLIDGYLKALESELSGLGEPHPVQTLFFGGGTPTHLPPPQLQSLLDQVRRWLPLRDGYEFSVEANPRDLDDERIAVLVEAGVNRVSLGAQSFDAEALTVLERDHNASDIIGGIERLRAAGIDNISIDLIFAVPGQSAEQWQRTLSELPRIVNIEHVSTYGLTYEKGTSFWRRRSAGELRSAQEEVERQMYAAAMDLLPAAGFSQYEISSFARPGRECRHNQVYWQGETYLAFGPGAARHVDGVRSTNHRSVTTWLKRVLAGQSAIAETERLNAEDRARELVMLGLRQNCGIDVDRFAERTQFALEELAPTALADFLERGLLEEFAGHVRLTREGRFLADTVTAEFLG